MRCLARIASPSSGGEGAVIKIFYTTSGLSEALYNSLDEESMIAGDSSSPGTARRSRRARQIVSY